MTMTKYSKSHSKALPLKKRGSMKNVDGQAASREAPAVIGADEDSQVESEQDILSETSPKVLKNSSSSGAASAIPPYFHYVDRSEEPDDDPLTPLVPMARVPTFPAKIYAILAHTEFNHIITWLPHGRSWKIVDMKLFENDILPKFFEHSRLSSFIRQANGWGFRRITKGGMNRDSYYQEYFLRGLPHLWKDMSRPGTAKKTVINPEHEPDLDAITKLHPLPPCTKTPEVAAIFECTMNGGPKARMPICPDASVVASIAQLTAKSRFSKNKRVASANSSNSQEGSPSKKLKGEDEMKISGSQFVQPTAQQTEQQQGVPKLISKESEEPNKNQTAPSIKLEPNTTPYVAAGLQENVMAMQQQRDLRALLLLNQHHQSQQQVLQLQQQFIARQRQQEQHNQNQILAALQGLQQQQQLQEMNNSSHSILSAISHGKTHSNTTLDRIASPSVSSLLVTQGADRAITLQDPLLRALLEEDMIRQQAMALQEQQHVAALQQRAAAMQQGSQDLVLRRLQELRHSNQLQQLPVATTPQASYATLELLASLIAKDAR